MKKIIITISLLSLLLTSCDNIPNTETGWWYKGQNINEFEYKGHTYISLGNNGIAHAGHCKCNNNNEETWKE